MKKYTLATIIFLLAIFVTTNTAFAQPELKPDFDAAVVKLNAGKFKSAADDFTSIIAKATVPDFLKFCYIYRAFCYRDLGSYKAAVADMDKAIELDPSDIASYTDRGNIKRRMGDIPGATADYKTVLASDSTGGQAEAALYYLGNIAYGTGNYEGAVKYYSQYIAINSKDAEVYFNRGSAKSMLMDSKGAIADYDKAIALKPAYMEAYANRGVAKINLLTTGGNISPDKKQTADACEDLQKAKSMGDTTVDDMIEIYCGNGDKVKRIKN